MSARRDATGGDGPQEAAGDQRGEPVLELEEVTRVYPGEIPVQALRGVSLRVRTGERGPEAI